MTVNLSRSIPRSHMTLTRRKFVWDANPRRREWDTLFLVRRRAFSTVQENKQTEETPTDCRLINGYVHPVNHKLVVEMRRICKSDVDFSTDIGSRVILIESFILSIDCFDRKISFDARGPIFVRLRSAYQKRSIYIGQCPLHIETYNIYQFIPPVQEKRPTKFDLRLNISTLCNLALCDSFPQRMTVYFGMLIFTTRPITFPIWDIPIYDDTHIRLTWL